MVEIHNLPTAEVYSATLYTIVNNSFDAGVALAKVVMFDRNLKLENGSFGIKRFVQISSNILTTIPAHNSKITIDTIDYIILAPIRRANPGFTTFWESEIKKTS